jgi:hypothetical protein
MSLQNTSEPEIAIEPSVETAVPYRALCPMAVASVVVGALSILTSLSWWLIVIPILGIWLGWQAYQQIQTAPSEWTGHHLVWVGIGLSIGFGILGGSWLFFAQVSEVPYGYERLDFAALQPDPNTPTDPIPEAAHNLQDKRVYIRGYMQPRRQQSGIKEFILCPSNGECPYCIPKPTSTQMIRVILPADITTFYTNHPIGVAGRFQVDPNDPSRVPYSIEVDQSLR